MIQIRNANKSSNKKSLNLRLTCHSDPLALGWQEINLRLLTQLPFSKDRGVSSDIFATGEVRYIAACQLAIAEVKSPAIDSVWHGSKLSSLSKRRFKISAGENYLCCVKRNKYFRNKIVFVARLIWSVSSIVLLSTTF